MSLPERRWSTATRLTLSNAGVIVACFLILLVLVLWLSQRFMRSHMEESVGSELNMLVGELRIDGRAGLIDLVGHRVRHAARDHERYYRLEDADRRLLAGNLEDWPAGLSDDATHVELPSPRHAGKTLMITSSLRFANGDRLLVGFDENELHHDAVHLRQGALWSLLLVLVMSVVAGRFITRTALRPIETIRESARQIMHGDLKHRIPVAASGDEFDQLAGTLNEMLDRIAWLIAGIEGTTDNIAHDLRSPLTRHRARLEAALKSPPSADEWQGWIERHLADLDQVLSTFQALLKIARVDSGILRGEFGPIDLSQLCHDAGDFMEPLAESRGQRISLQLPAVLPLTGHRDLLFQLIINLLDNAIKYSPADSEIVLSCCAGDDACELGLRDQGPGIPVAERTRVLERLYRLDSTRQTPGLGLGLSLVQAVVHLHAGTLVLDGGEPGLIVRIRLPLMPS